MDAGIIAQLKPTRRCSGITSKMTVSGIDEGNSIPDRGRSSFLRQHVYRGSAFHSAFYSVGTEVKAEQA